MSAKGGASVRRGWWVSHYRWPWRKHQAKLSHRPATGAGWSSEERQESVCRKLPNTGLTSRGTRGPTIRPRPCPEHLTYDPRKKLARGCPRGRLRGRELRFHRSCLSPGYLRALEATTASTLEQGPGSPRPTGSHTVLKRKCGALACG